MSRRRRLAGGAGVEMDHRDTRPVDRLQAQVNGLEADIQALLAVAKSGGTRSKLHQQVKPRDTPWQCANCQNLLGWYDRDKEIMRIRYKQQSVFVRIGVNGFVQSICVNCTEPNTLHYEPPEDEEAGGDPEAAG